MKTTVIYYDKLGTSDYASLIKDLGEMAPLDDINQKFEHSGVCEYTQSGTGDFHLVFSGNTVINHEATLMWVLKNCNRTIFTADILAEHYSGRFVRPHAQISLKELQSDVVAAVARYGHLIDHLKNHISNPHDLAHDRVELRPHGVLFKTQDINVH